MFYVLKNNLMIIQTIQMSNNSENNRFRDYYSVCLGLSSKPKFIMKLQFV